MYLTKAPTLTILLPIYDATGVMRFPNSGGPYFGLHCLVDNALPLSKQAVRCAERYFGRDDLSDKLEAVAAIDPVLRQEGESSSVLFLMRPKGQPLEADKSWFTIAQVLRSMPAGGNRLAYMKALQYMAGAADAEVSVLEVDEEVRQRLKELASESSENLVD
ncbi:MAG: hypothetical protein EOP09_18260 [Proteobacteria bacterium]|nr:MAG: hypothetical protein EOP09_18260 [Pseudomonadota bacterium]